MKVSHKLIENFFEGYFAWRLIISFAKIGYAILGNKQTNLSSFRFCCPILTYQFYTVKNLPYGVAKLR